jgi:hypothetical protein
MTRRWSKGDSNSPSHPERQRSEGRHMGPAHRSRFRSRAAVIVTLAALPILWTPNVVVARMVVGGFRVVIPGALLFAADGWIVTGYVFVWQIALTRCRATRPRGSPGLAQTLAPLAGNRGFESTSLQRRVSCELDSPGFGHLHGVRHPGPCRHNLEVGGAGSEYFIARVLLHHPRAQYLA